METMSSKKQTGAKLVAERFVALSCAVASAAKNATANSAAQHLLVRGMNFMASPFLPGEQASGLHRRGFGGSKNQAVSAGIAFSCGNVLAPAQRMVNDCAV